MSCADCSIAEVGSAEFMRSLAARPRLSGELPIAGSIDLTNRCNLHCRHCYIHYPGSPGEELSTDEARRLLDKLASDGVLSVLLTGGEIFLRQDFRTLYQHALQKGFLLTLFTNATTIDDSLADFLAASPPRRLEVTLYGHTAPVYEQVTQGKGLFERFRAGVQRLLDRRLPVHFKAMVLRSNAHEFEAMREWAESTGCPFRHDAIVNPRLDGDRGPLEERVSAADAAVLLGTGDTSRDFFEKLRSLARDGGADRRLIKCGAGVKTFHVDAGGFMHPCMMLRNHGYDYLHGSAQEWNHQMAQLRSETASPSLCDPCEFRLACPNCAAASRLETGVEGAAVEYFCEVCRERAQRLKSASFGLE